MSPEGDSQDDFPSSEEELEELLSRPPPHVVSMMHRLQGDILVLGAGGKMGPSLSIMAKRASDLAGGCRRIMAASRFKDVQAREELEKHGIETFSSDLLEQGALEALPDAPNVIFMAGMKFGSTGQEPLTWAMNVLLPGLVCRRFEKSRIAAFSTGNVYGLVPSDSAGSKESDPPDPVGEYAQSCLGRERMFQHAALTYGTKVALIRLNYACDLRYGVLVDIARRVWTGQPVDIGINAFNIIWQADANAVSLLCLELADSPAFIGNVSGLEKLSVVESARFYSNYYNKETILKSVDSQKALLSNSKKLLERLDYRPKNVAELTEWVARWVAAGAALLDKPTGFEKIDGRF